MGNWSSIIPNYELAEQSLDGCDNGINVNEFGQTNIKDIFVW